MSGLDPRSCTESFDWNVDLMISMICHTSQISSELYWTKELVENLNITQTWNVKLIKTRAPFADFKYRRCHRHSAPALMSIFFPSVFVSPRKWWKAKVLKMVTCANKFVFNPNPNPTPSKIKSYMVCFVRLNHNVCILQTHNCLTETWQTHSCLMEI